MSRNWVLPDSGHRAGDGGVGVCSQRVGRGWVSWQEVLELNRNGRSVVISGFHGHWIWRGPMAGNGNQATPLWRVIRLDPRGSVCDLLGHHLSNWDI